MKRISLALLGPLVTFLMLPLAAPAQTGAIPFEDAVARANLVFVGEVASIEYREPQDAPEGTDLPFTFVTYTVDRVLRGAWEDARITLRFAGGYSPSSGRVSLNPLAPMFRVGNRDLLLVRGNGAAFCPLVGCGQGRFRIAEGAVYSSLGLAVRIGSDGRTRHGPDALGDAEVAMDVPAAPERRLRELRAQLDASDLTEAERDRMGAMLRVLSRPQTIGVARRGARPSPPAAPPVSEAAFLRRVQTLADAAPAAPAAERTLSADAPFRVSLPAATEARQPPSRPSGPVVQRERTREQVLLERNGGNPVLEVTP
ncbi:hypothetical protein ROJ8625_03306 [Roseivivax jejudonensis]|uniref:Uncharacterized protein n=1 Tax=Roseivivax jejudonensis TaxID=1529041 RepID=A0A1X6ZY14_9RHOB|nr:hypothetical protein [Roseivivax jejudonensis]SLN64950.1 hypothetical protein ROJ8625_03306 [Roseivivax jejudonensis]